MQNCPCFWSLVLAKFRELSSLLALRLLDMALGGLGLNKPLREVDDSCWLRVLLGVLSLGSAPTLFRVCGGLMTMTSDCP